MSNPPSPDWNPRASSVLRDQRRSYDELRERCPVAHSDFLNWSIFRHEDIVSILADPNTYSNATARGAIPNGMDPPEHTIYRQALEPYFGGEAMRTVETHCQRIAAETVQALRARAGDEVEFVSEFAEPCTGQALCAYLGWPLDGWARLSAWNRDNQRMTIARDREMGNELALAFVGYVEEALTVRRTTGGEVSDDITSRLMRMEVAGKPLSADDIVSVLRNWVAGHGTVAAALGNVTLYLAEHQDVQQRLRSEPALLPAALDEILRVDGPLVANTRTTTRAVEIGGRQIGAGEKLSLIWLAANRDGSVFDDPDTVHIDRGQTDGNLLFGAGIHDCVGAPLARLEMRIAIEELLRGTSRITLSDAQPPVRATYPSNGLESLKIRLN